MVIGYISSSRLYYYPVTPGQCVYDAVGLKEWLLVEDSSVQHEGGITLAIMEPSSLLL